MASNSSSFGKWEAASQSAIEAIRTSATTTSFWEALKVHYSEENQSESVNWDNVSFVKSICERLCAPWEREKLITPDRSPNARRCALGIPPADID